jgi:hypothetical protein
MIHLTGAMGRDANDGAGHAAATRPARVYRVTRRGWPSSEVSRPLLPLNPPNGGAPGMSESSARTGVATDALSVEAGGVSRTREADSATSSDRAADGSGLDGVAGGLCTMAGCGEGVAGCGSKSGSRERSIRGRGVGATRRTSFLGSGVGGAGGRARSGVGAITTGGAAGIGVGSGASLSTGLHSVEYPVSATGIARSAIAAMLARKANGLRRSPRARATRS